MDEPETRRQQLYDLLGELPDRDRPVGATLIAEEQRPAYTVETLLLDLNGREPVPAYFTRPPGTATGPLPTVLYAHASGLDIGRAELLEGRAKLQSPPYAEALARAGYAALCIDLWGFGDRRGRTLDSLFKDMLWRGQVLWENMVYDNLKALDYLVSRPDVDGERIATLGLSLGSTMSWWTSALDTRVRVCVDICCLTDYQALIETRGLDGHGVYYYVPKLLKHFTSGQINALIAPRPHLGLAGNYDPLTPPRGLDRIDAEVSAAYESLGAADAWKLSRYEVGHLETAPMRAEIMAFLARWL